LTLSPTRTPPSRAVGRDIDAETDAVRGQSERVRFNLIDHAFDKSNHTNLRFSLRADLSQSNDPRRFGFMITRCRIVRNRTDIVPDFRNDPDAAAGTRSPVCFRAADGFVSK
jgi:hypothetical protein